MVKRLKENKGITLIALVITIIVLLILAGVAISMLSGENGILNQAARAKQRTGETSVEEQVKLAAAAAMANNYHTIAKEELIKELAKYGLKLDNEESDVWTVTDQGITYTIKSNGDVSKKEEKSGLSAADLKDNADAIGAEVNYIAPVDSDIKWRLFFADNENIYLIAKDYISVANLPSKNGNKPEYENDEPKAGTFINVYNLYDGSKNIIDNNTLKSALGTYYKWANNHPSASNPNIKAVAYMLDTDIWTKQYGTEKTKYVIGGPTIEMFATSYNTKGGHESGKEIIEIDYESGENGYKVKWKGESSYNNYIEGLNTSEYKNLYIIDTEPVITSYWLASPSNESSSFVMDVNDSGCVGIDRTDITKYGGLGFRPIVCLNSDVKLMGNPTDGYTIQ